MTDSFKCTCAGHPHPSLKQCECGCYVAVFYDSPGSLPDGMTVYAFPEGTKPLEPPAPPLVGDKIPHRRYIVAGYGCLECNLFWEENEEIIGTTDSLEIAEKHKQHYGHGCSDNAAFIIDTSESFPELLD